VFEKVAAQGHADAQCNLGWMYAKGEGSPQSFEQARHWYEKAAEHRRPCCGGCAKHRRALAVTPCRGLSAAAWSIVRKSRQTCRGLQHVGVSPRWAHK